MYLALCCCCWYCSSPPPPPPPSFNPPLHSSKPKLLLLVSLYLARPCLVQSSHHPPHRRLVLLLTPQLPTPTCSLAFLQPSSRPSVLSCFRFLQNLHQGIFLLRLPPSACLPLRLLLPLQSLSACRLQSPVLAHQTTTRKRRTFPLPVCSPTRPVADAPAHDPSPKTSHRQLLGTSQPLSATRHHVQSLRAWLPSVTTTSTNLPPTAQLRRRPRLGRAGCCLELELHLTGPNRLLYTLALTRTLPTKRAGTLPPQPRSRARLPTCPACLERCMTG